MDALRGLGDEFNGCEGNRENQMLTRENIIGRIYCGILLVIWILGPYLILQKVEIFPVIIIPEMAIDRAIPVCYPGVWVYYSFYILLGWVGLSVEKPIFIRYLYTVGWVALVSHMIFLFFPNGVARTDIVAANAPWYYQMLAMVDEPRNALPSLHASLSVVAAIAVQSSSRFSGLIKCCVWLWVLAIFWSTIALRQHVMLDLLAGSIVAVSVWRVVGNSREMSAHAV